MFFDTHSHYDDESFDADRDEILSIMPQSGVELIVDPGCNEQSSEKAIELAGRYDFVYAAVGWHPENAEEFDDASPDKLRAWAKNPKVRAIGEIGLDYCYDDGAPRDVQRAVFIRQMELAEELELPVIVHDREAHADSLEIVRRFPKVRGVFHCYSGSPETARELISLGWYISFTGAITFKNARRAPESIAVCPMDRIMIETDSPYLAPVPNRGKRNDSRNLVYVARRIAEIKGINEEEAARISLENGRRFFGI